MLHSVQERCRYENPSGSANVSTAATKEKSKKKRAASTPMSLNSAKKKKKRKKKSAHDKNTSMDPFSVDLDHMLKRQAKRRKAEMKEQKRHNKKMEEAALDPWKRKSSELEYKAQCLQQYEEMKDKPWVTDAIILEMFPGEIGKVFVNQRREHDSDGNSLYGDK